MFNEAMSASLQMPVALEMLGIAVGSMCGTLDACRRKLDILGGVGLGMICGLGGGLIRDTIMQKGSIYMLESPLAIPVSVAVALVVFFFHSPFEKHPNAIEWLDILSIALFAASGSDKAVVYGLTPPAVILMGVLAGNGGGLLRDIVMGDVPHLFQKDNWYAICALFGSLIYWLFVGLLAQEKGLAACVSVFVTVATRRAALRFNLQSPADVDLTPKVAGSITRIRRRQRRRHRI